MFVKELINFKQYFGIIFTVSGITKFFNSEHLKKESSASEVTKEGIVNVVNQFTSFPFIYFKLIGNKISSIFL